MARKDTTTPEMIITPRGFVVWTNEIDRYRRRIAQSEVTLATSDYFWIDPNAGRNSGSAAQVAS